jgi:uncharacterized protein (TIGR02271 family)
MRYDKSRVRVGMTAVSNRGENLGKVARSEDQAFVIEKGVFFPKDYLLRYEYITDIRGDQLVYALEDARAASAAATPATAASAPAMPATATTRPGAAVAAVAGTITGAAERAVSAIRGGNGALRRLAGDDLETDQELRLPLREEEITVEKVNRETGHVRIHKAVRTEERHITVPVTREEVVVERLPASAGASAAPEDDDSFQERTIDVAVHEEEVHVSKHPVVREELRVRKVAHEERRDAAATLRHEEVHIEDTTPARTARAARKG